MEKKKKRKWVLVEHNHIKQGRKKGCLLLQAKFAPAGTELYETINIYLRVLTFNQLHLLIAI